MFKNRWLPGCIIQKPGPLSYVIKLSDSRIIRRHYDHVRIRSSVDVSQDNMPDDNMILTATVPVDTLVPISIVAYYLNPLQLSHNQNQP